MRRLLDRLTMYYQHMHYLAGVHASTKKMIVRLTHVCIRAHHCKYVYVRVLVFTPGADCVDVSRSIWS